MRHHLAFALLAAVLLCSGCVLPSVYPVAPDAPHVSVEWAKGVWINRPSDDRSGEAANDAACVLVTCETDGRTLIQYSQVGKDSNFLLRLEARTFELDGHLFASLKLQDEEFQRLGRQYPGFIIPTYVLARIDRQADGGVVVRMASGEAVARRLKGTGEALAAIASANSSNAYALTADSAAVTAFFTANAANEALYDLKLNLARPKLPPAAGTIPAP